MSKQHPHTRRPAAMPRWFLGRPGHVYRARYGVLATVPAARRSS